VRAPATWQALHYLHDPEGFFTHTHRRYGDMFTIQMLGEEWIVLAHPDAVAEVFAHSPEDLNSGEPLQVLRPVIGTRNLLLLDGEEHLHRRRIVLPPFHGDRMRAYEPTIRQAITHELSSWPTGTPFPVLPRTEALAFSTILSCVFGLRDQERMSTLATSLLGMLRWITDPRRLLVLFFAGPARLMNLPRFRRQMQKIDHEVLTEIARRRTLKDLSQREDILSLLIGARDENDTGLSDTELRDELLTLLVAGHQNTAALLAWAMHELARDQHSQERLAAEPSVYADAVITETLRLRPSVPLVVRRLRKPLTIAGHKLPAGTNLGPCALLVHRRADLYPQPLTFKPTRFLDRRPSSSEWFPFGGAVRRCIGASFARFEARIILEEITRTLRITPEHPQPERAKPRAIVLVPARGARIIATKR
jgi:cytochrome P450